MRTQTRTVKPTLLEHMYLGSSRVKTNVMKLNAGHVRRSHRALVAILIECAIEKNKSPLLWEIKFMNPTLKKKAN